MKPDSANIRIIRWPLILASLTAAVGVGLSVYLQGRIAQTEATAAKLTAETLRSNTEQELTLFADVLESVGALHALSDAVDQAAMDEFVEKGLVYQHEVLGPFGLTQRINPWLRADIEGKEKNQPGAYQIVERGPDGTWVPAEPKPVYYPLTWQSRTDGLNVPVGFDFASLGEEAIHTIEQIENTRRPALVPSPIREQESGVRGQRTEDGRQRTEDRNQGSERRHPFPITPTLQYSHTPTPPPSPSYWVFAPVIPSSPFYPPNTVLGFTVAVLHPEAILKRVAALSAPSSRLQLKLSGPADSPSAETIRMKHNTWLYRSPLEVIGTQWIFECSLPISVTGHRSTAALAAGLIITALMTSLLLLLAGRTRKIEAEVLARTEDLRIANTRLEENLFERARLEEEMHELAARERRRIGRDLHDSLGQKLTGAVFLSRSLLNWFQKHGAWGMEHGENNSTADTLKNPHPVPGSPLPAFGPQADHAKTLNETLKDAVAQVRNMARGLAPVTLNDESLCESLEQLAEEVTGLYGVSCEVTECTEPAALDQKAKEQLYLIAREAVNNAARHAHAGRVTVRLIANGAGWKLRVEDDGAGFHGGSPTPATAGGEPPPLQHSGSGGGGTCPATGGMGIRIMRHRAGLIGAAFAINSTQGQGTCVAVKSV